MNVIGLIRDLNLNSSDAATFTIYVSLSDQTWAGLIETTISDLGRETSALNRELAENVAAIVAAASGVAVAGSEVRLLPEYRLSVYPKRLVWFQKDPGEVTTVASVGSTASPTLVGTAASINDSSGQYIEYTSAATINNSCGWFYGSGGVALQNAFRNTFVFKMPADITSYRCWIGTFSATTFLASDTPSVELAGFRFSTSVPDTNWVMCSSTGAVQTSTATDIAVAANTRYELEVDASISGEVSFYVNRIFKGTLSTNLPTATTPLGPAIAARNLVAATRRILVSHMGGESL